MSEPLLYCVPGVLSNVFAVWSDQYDIYSPHAHGLVYRSGSPVLVTVQFKPTGSEPCTMVCPGYCHYIGYWHYSLADWPRLPSVAVPGDVLVGDPLLIF